MALHMGISTWCECQMLLYQNSENLDSRCGSATNTGVLDNFFPSLNFSVSNSTLKLIRAWCKLDVFLFVLISMFLSFKKLPYISHILEYCEKVSAPSFYILHDSI